MGVFDWAVSRSTLKSWSTFRIRLVLHEISWSTKDVSRNSGDIFREVNHVIALLRQLRRCSSRQVLQIVNNYCWCDVWVYQSYSVARIMQLRYTDFVYMLFFMHIRRTGTKCLSPSNGVAWQRPPSLFLMGDEQNKDGASFWLQYTTHRHSIILQICNTIGLNIDL